MKRESLKETFKDITVSVGPDVRMVAFCSHCNCVVFRGNDGTEVERRVLKERVADHLDYFEGEHTLLVFFPKRETGQFMDAESYLETGAGMTIRTDFSRMVHRSIPTV